MSKGETQSPMSMLYANLENGDMIMNSSCLDKAWTNV